MIISRFALRNIVALAVLVMMTSACGDKNPIGPTPIAGVCEDTAANNIGQPLPCKYPVVSKITIEEVWPPSGSTVRYDMSSDQNIRISFSFVFDGNIPGRVVLQTALSTDCVNLIPSYLGFTSVSGTSGFLVRSAGVESRLGIRQTTCVNARIVTIDSESKVTSIIVQEWKPWVFNFQ